MPFISLSICLLYLYRLRPIIIDGQNVGMEHGKENSIGPVLGSTGLDWRKKFSARGIELCVEYFKKRGHDQVVAWLPRKPKVSFWKQELKKSMTAS